MNICWKSYWSAKKAFYIKSYGLLAFSILWMIAYQYAESIYGRMDAIFATVSAYTLPALLLIYLSFLELLNFLNFQCLSCRDSLFIPRGENPILIAVQTHRIKNQCVNCNIKIHP